MQAKLISFIVPVYNESASLRQLYAEIEQVMLQHDNYDWELLFIDDGSQDDSAKIIASIATEHSNAQPVYLARNFGKEIALTAGLNACKGDAAIMLDSDLQHPPRYAHYMLSTWAEGADVVIGVRKVTSDKNVFKKAGSAVFNWVMNKIGDVPFVPGATDFRLLDRSVINEFNRFTERGRITRGLIDWLGFDRKYFYFVADERKYGQRSYSIRKLFVLAQDSLVSLSLVPLRISGYLGLAIMIVFGPLGLFMVYDKYLNGNRFDFTPGTSVGVLLMFVAGVILFNLGLMALYIATIHRETGNRPLYVTKQPRT